jgi:nifR3 family TIM-barrel protein
MSKLLEALKKNPLVLAPMAGITDSAFRSFMREMGAGVVVTELISATGTQYQSERTLRLMDFQPDQHPVGIQLFGEDPLVMAHAARVAEERGCDFVDLNFGCPVPKVVKKGGGSAILKDLKALEVMVRTVKAAISIPLTIKIRTGWDQNSRNADEVCRIAYNEGVTWVAIHGRTRAQGYSGHADWDYIAQVKAQSPLPIIGNGDLHSPQMIERRLKKSGCDAVMVGRGCLKNPFLFSDTLKHLYGDTQSPLPNRDLWSVYSRLHHHLATQCDDTILTIQLKKFAAWYSSGYSGASQFRKSIFQTKEKNETLEIAEEYFKSLNLETPEDTTQEPFLMGGHG